MVAAVGVVGFAGIVLVLGLVVVGNVVYLVPFFGVVGETVSIVIFVASVPSFLPFCFGHNFHPPAPASPPPSLLRPVVSAGRN